MPNVKIVRDALSAQSVAHPLGGHGSCHQRYNVPHSARQLKHDHYQRDGHASYTSQHSCCSHNRIQSGRNEIAVRTLARKEPDVGIAVCKLFHADSHNAAHDGSQQEGRNKQTSRDFHAKCKDSEGQFEYKGEHQQPNGAVDTGTWFRDLDDGVARRDVHALVVAKKNREH